MKTPEVLRLLWSAVEANRAAQRAPFAPGETARPITSPTAYFTDDHWNALQRLVNAVRRDAPAIYNRFAGSSTISHTIVRKLDEETECPSLARIIELLSDESGGEQRWLIATPLANLAVPNRIVPLSDVAALCPAEPDSNWTSASESTVTSGFDLRTHLGDWLSVRPQWLKAGRRPAPIDTRVTAALVTVEDGTRNAVQDIARTRAGYALAVWTLEQQDTDRRYIWPTEGIWGPQPNLDLGQTIKPFEPDMFAPRSSSSSRIIEHGAWQLADDETLRLPFQAMRHAHDAPHALAVLAAARALYLAARFPSDLTVSERHLQLFTAVATLCETDGSFSTKAMLKRWRKLRSGLDLHRELLLAGYSTNQLVTAEEHLKHVRDMAAHAPDSVLINLGYPAERIRTFSGNQSISGEQLSRAMLLSDLRPLLYIVRLALMTVIRRMAEADWDRAAFDGLFAHSED